MPIPNTFLVISAAGPNRELSKGSREQRYWDEHATFIDGLVDEGFILLGGPFPEDGGALLVVQAESEAAVRTKMDGDPWYEHGMLILVTIKRWDIFIDQWPKKN